MIAIIDYGVGNLASIQNMFKKAGVIAEVCSKSEEIEAAAKIVLPGMGAFDNCMQKYNDSGFRDIVEQKVMQDKIPVLGICVGLQMFMESSEEGKLPGLGWVKGKTVLFDHSKLTAGQKIPNMGWLDTYCSRETKLMQGIEEPRYYFAHSYHIVVSDNTDTAITANYGYDFTAGIEKGNILGVQFHPEKSHRFGMQLFKNFAQNY